MFVKQTKLFFLTYFRTIFTIVRALFPLNKFVNKNKTNKQNHYGKKNQKHWPKIKYFKCKGNVVNNETYNICNKKFNANCNYGPFFPNFLKHH